MKKFNRADWRLIAQILSAVFVVAVIFFSLGFKSAPGENNVAKVNRVDGVYVFIESQPANDYDVLGTVKKTGFTLGGTIQEQYKVMTRRCRKDYPDADGIIFDDISLEHGTCIKFK